ncbi:MAG TPA: glycosyltransferase family 87 protein [Bryobacteraceae bacterium]|nr:glycosyltransferase family 87 protein [Bryobacteraceae bacterium]
MRRFADWLPIALGIALISTLAGLQWHRTVRGQNDFAALYAGATLAGTPDLYSRSANEALIQSTTGGIMKSVMYTRPPFYAVLLKPLASLPYLVAYGIFCCLSIASILWFVIRFSKECEALPLCASFSIPVAAFLPQGQDAPLLLMFTGASILLTRRRRDFLAGAVLSLCAIKFHLFLLLPLLLLVKKRWRILAGAAAGTATLALIGVAGAGTHALAGYAAVLRDPWINFSTEMMPNLHGLAAGLTRGAAGPMVDAGMACATTAVFLWISQKSDNYEFLFGLSLLCSLLISYHSGISDLILLLPVLVLMAGSSADKPLRISLVILLTPIPYFTGLGINLMIPALMLVVLALAALSVASLPRRAVPAFIS